MLPKRELSLEQVQEIRTLRGVLPAAEVKKRFGIGTTRLYRIWRGEAADQPPLDPPAPPEPAPIALPEPAPIILPGAQLVADAREEEEAETRVDMQKIGQMAASAQKWAYISIAAALVWKVAASTWKQCGSPPLAAAVSAMRGNRPQHPSGPETGAGPQPPAVRDAGPGDPFYMA
ncbi:hypothetical protein ElyMa_004504400 [Elysia marginata]|uniref:HTH psq-type domain-containing protein n=1 Tax=Elysia marginata TaxID=1093978 RepID=A0AAV4HM90_9GAST|nr:hypothetical protein ElyMa_004504400 [Elysia marginata]